MKELLSVDNLANILSERVDISNFIIGEYKGIPETQGCLLKNDKWYIFSVDEKAQAVFTGPFMGNSIVFACAIKLGCSSLFQEYSFDDDEMSAFIHSHFYSERDL